MVVKTRQLPDMYGGNSPTCPHMPGGEEIKEGIEEISPLPIIGPMSDPGHLRFCALEVHSVPALLPKPT